MLRLTLFLSPFVLSLSACSPTHEAARGDSLTPDKAVGTSLLPGAKPGGRVFVDESRLVILEEDRGNGGAPARVFANELIVVAKDAQSLQQLAAHVERVGLTSPLRPVIARTIPGRPIALIRAESQGLHAPGPLLDALQLPSALASSLRVYPNGVLRMFANQDLLDPGPSERQWALFNPGLPGGQAPRPDADADGVDALVRMRSTGPAATRDIVVAVLDTGIDIGHEALGPALWRNPGEIPDNGLDDDRNGYVDDVHGWNFADNTPDVRDWRGHGTHVSGIIAARRPLQPEKGIWGIAPFSKILTAKIPLRNSNLTSAFVATHAISYAADLGVDVMNMSFGSNDLDILLRDAIWSAAPTIHMVAAAGNDGVDLKQAPVYPCSLHRVICVVSSTMQDERAATSNYDRTSMSGSSEKSLFIAAPGDQIHSTLPSSGYGQLSGTSMAAPLVAGTLAAVKSMHPQETHEQHQLRLFGNADRIPALESWVDEGRRLNAYQAIYGPVAGGTRSAQTPYCLEQISVPHDPAPHPRWQNRPYANSGEPNVDGSSTRPYTLCSVEQLSGIRDEHLGRVFHLRQHIHWTPGHYPIGGSPRPAGQPPLPFLGVLIGNGFSIFNMSFRGGATGGLIAHLGFRGQVVDLQLRNVDIQASASAGGVAVLSEGRIVGVHVDGRIQGRVNVGGLAGEMRDGLIDQSYFSGEVVSSMAAGGLVGVMMGRRQTGPRPIVRTSQARGVVQGGEVGGIAGRVQHRSEISGAYAWVHIIEGSTVGGVAGSVQCGSQITSSYAQGILRGSGPVGTLIGKLSDAHLSNSYASALVDEGPQRGGSVGAVIDGLKPTRGSSLTYECTGTQVKPPPSTVAGAYYDSFLSPGRGTKGAPKTPAELRQRATFTGWFNADTDWHMEDGFMPVLKGLPRSW